MHNFFPRHILFRVVWVFLLLCTKLWHLQVCSLPLCTRIYIFISVLISYIIQQHTHIWYVISNESRLECGLFVKTVKNNLISSCSGFLVSLDDFYLLGSGLMMTQTTNNVFNSSLFDTVTPDSLLAWQRVRLAHSLARNGEEWAKTFAKHNSGEWLCFCI